MGKDSDIAIAGKAMKAVRSLRRKTYGVPCPRCTELQPRRDATVLLPGQRCKVDGYVDPRERITQAQEDALWETQGYRRVPNADG